MHEKPCPIYVQREIIQFIAVPPKDDLKDLRNVIKEAGNLLDQLDERGSGPSSLHNQTRTDQTNQPASQDISPKKTISTEMLARLRKIDTLEAQGYDVKKEWNAFPILLGSSGIRKPVLPSSPAGFSWIAFFFPFAVCTQIREWSYFYVTGVAYLAGSAFYKITGWDPAWAISLAISWQYAIYFPYLRWLALRERKTEISRRKSIIIGLALSFVCTIPSILFEAIFIGS